MIGLDKIVGEIQDTGKEVLNSLMFVLLAASPYLMVWGGIELYKKAHPGVRQVFPIVYECKSEKCPGHESGADKCKGFAYECEGVACPGHRAPFDECEGAPKKERLRSGGYKKINGQYQWVPGEIKK